MSKERRRFPRIHEPFAMHYRVSAGGAWCDAHVINVSAGGLRFRCAEGPPDTDAVLQVKVALSESSEPVMLAAQVAWSQLMASGVIEVGVEFQDIAAEESAMVSRLMGFGRTSA